MGTGKMAYENYKVTASKEEYFQNWQDPTSQLTEELKATVYSKYAIKCRVFQRDNFTCQNEMCKNPRNRLTMHHIKWRKNDGKDAERNCLTLCRACHSGYHKRKRALRIRDRAELPSHFRGHTFKLNKEEQFNWKKLKSEMKQLRKNIRHLHGIKLSEEQLRVLMLFLFAPYEDME